MRAKFDSELLELSNMILRMGSLCEDAVILSGKVIESGDNSLIETINDREREIDQMERDISSLSMRLLLSEQPVASDLRKISTALKMVTDLERIGDQCADISELVPYLESLDKPWLDKAVKMANVCSEMVMGSVNAFAGNDIELARKTIKMDDEVDSLFLEVRKSLSHDIEAGDVRGEALVDLLICAKYYERIGDHAVNVSEWVIYAATGERKV